MFNYFGKKYGSVLMSGWRLASKRMILLVPCVNDKYEHNIKGCGSVLDVDDLSNDNDVADAGNDGLNKDGLYNDDRKYPPELVSHPAAGTAPFTPPVVEIQPCQLQHVSQ
jgi:hypothetical protein